MTSQDGKLIDDLQFVATCMGGGGREECEARVRHAQTIEQPKVIVEIGVLRGQGLCSFALGSKFGHQVRVFGIDLFGMRSSGQGPSYDDPKNFRVATQFVARVGCSELVSIWKNESLVAAHEWDKTGHVIGLLEIDAGHDYEDVVEDFRAWSRHVPVGGLLMMHDARNPAWRGVDKVIAEEIVPSGQWEEVEFVAPFSAWFRRVK